MIWCLESSVGEAGRVSVPCRGGDGSVRMARMSAGREGTRSSVQLAA